MMIEIEPLTNITLAGLHARHKEIHARLMSPKRQYPATVLPTPPARLPAAPVPPPVAPTPLRVERLRSETGPEAARTSIPLPSPLTTHRILIEVAAFSGVSIGDIISSERRQPVIRLRQIACYLAKTLTTGSFPQIGRRIGGRNHSTVLHAFRKITRLLRDDESLAADIAELTLRLTNHDPHDPHESSSEQETEIAALQPDPNPENNATKNEDQKRDAASGRPRQRVGLPVATLGRTDPGATAPPLPRTPAHGLNMVS